MGWYPTLGAPNALLTSAIWSERFVRLAVQIAVVDVHVRAAAITPVVG